MFGALRELWQSLSQVTESPTTTQSSCRTVHVSSKEIVCFYAIAGLAVQSNLDTWQFD